MDFKKVFTSLKVASTIVENNGKINHDTVMAAFFDRRMSDERSYDYSWNSLILKSHKDFSSLANYKLHSFKSDNNTLYGYYYPVANPKGLILYVHGLGGSAFDWYAIGQNEWIQRGYAVFAIELTASGRSEGFGLKSLSQSAFDVARAVEYIQSNHELRRFPLFLFGHSWGGYGVTASLKFVSGVSAVAELSGFSTPLNEMAGLPEAKLNGISLGDTKPIEEALFRRAGENGNLSAIASIRNSLVPLFAVHGGKDQVVPYGEASILVEAKDFHQVSPMFLQDRDHINVFLSSSACKARDRALDIVKDATKQYGRTLDKVSADKIKEISSLIDKDACSEPNSLLFDAIDEFFRTHAMNIINP